MLRSVYGRGHCAELIQMTVLGGAATDQLFRSNAALLSGPSWAAPHVVGAQRAKTKLPAAGPRRAARRRLSTG
jgi:hypothetical protein